MAEVTPKKVAESLQKVINARRPSVLIDQFINWALTNYVTVENLNYAIENNVDILLLAFNHMHIGHPLVAPAFRLMIQMFWQEFIEYYVADVTRIYTILSKDPQVKVVLDTEAGRTYLNNCCKTAYDAFYNFAWSGYGEV